MAIIKGLCYGAVWLEEVGELDVQTFAGGGGSSVTARRHRGRGAGLDNALAREEHNTSYDATAGDVFRGNR